MYSASNLALKLRMSKHQPTPEVVAEVIAKCHAIGLLDDEAYGRALIRDIQLRKAAGPRLLQIKLMQKGLDHKLIEKLIRESAGQRDDFDAAMQMAKKKFKSLARLPLQKARQRLYGQLTRRGFEYDTVSSVMENLDWDAWGEGNDESWE
jgi:regulatory protein